MKLLAFSIFTGLVLVFGINILTAGILGGVSIVATLKMTTGLTLIHLPLLLRSLYASMADARRESTEKNGIAFKAVYLGVFLGSFLVVAAICFLFFLTIFASGVLFINGILEGNLLQSSAGAAALVFLYLQYRKNK